MSALNKTSLYFEKSDVKRTMHLSRCALESDYSFTVVKVLVFLIALFLLSDAFTPRLYLRENNAGIIENIQQIPYLPATCEKAWYKPFQSADDMCSVCLITIFVFPAFLPAADLLVSRTF